MEPKKKYGALASLTVAKPPHEEPDDDDFGGPPDDDEDDAPSGAHEVAYQDMEDKLGSEGASAVKAYVKACLAESGESYGKE
jgi:hypothetical protein